MNNVRNSTGFERALLLVACAAIVVCIPLSRGALINDITLVGFNPVEATPTVVVDGVSQTPTITGISEITHNTSPTHTWNVQLSGLDLNGVGANDDVLAFTFTIYGQDAGGAANIYNTQAGAHWYMGPGNSVINVAARKITMTISDMKRGLDGGSLETTDWSGGVSYFEVIGWGADEPGKYLTVNGDSYSPYSGAHPKPFGPIDPMAASSLFGYGNEAYGITTWDVQFLIPEPTSAILLALGGVMLLRRRSVVS